MLNFDHHQDLNLPCCRNPSLMRAGFHKQIRKFARELRRIGRNPSLMRAGFH
ncbi:MAG: hypothetical protein ACP5QP_08165 [Brevinematia bacterium]